MIVRFLPNLSPRVNAVIAPKKAPSEKQLEVIPDMFALFVCGNQCLKSSEIKTPENTPCEGISLLLRVKISSCGIVSYLVITKPGHRSLCDLISFSEET